MKSEFMTIGQLAKDVGVRTSTLRFYEDTGLLTPHDRTQAGYRLFAPEAAQRVRLIQRAQRLGFSLADIRPLLDAWDSGDLQNQAIIDIAENRYLALEKQVTERLVLQHELELFLTDLNKQGKPAGERNTAFDKLLERVCANPSSKSSANFMVDWLMEQANCNLTSEIGQEILGRLRGQHVHIWQEHGAYHCLFISGDEQVAAALKALADLEADCETHADTSSDFEYEEEGFLFIASGKNAFIFARLFLALEEEG